MRGRIPRSGYVADRGAREGGRSRTGLQGEKPPSASTALYGPGPPHSAITSPWPYVPGTLPPIIEPDRVRQRTVRDDVRAVRSDDPPSHFEIVRRVPASVHPRRGPLAFRLS